MTVPDYRDGILFLRDCLFRKMSLPATLYEGEQAKVISRNLIWDGLENESSDTLRCRFSLRYVQHSALPCSMDSLKFIGDVSAYSVSSRDFLIAAESFPASLSAFTGIRIFLPCQGVFQYLIRYIAGTEGFKETVSRRVFRIIEMQRGNP